MQLHSENYGAGHPFLILHGLFGSLENWRTLSKTLGKFFRVFAVDQRNHGRSPHSAIFNYQVMAEDLKELLLQHGLSSAYVLGHSMGGKTAMQFAVTYPDMVDAVIVVDIAPKAYASEHEAIFDALYRLELSTLRTRQAADIALAKTIQDTSLRQFLLKNLDRDAAGEFRWRIALDALYTNYREILKGLETRRKFAKPTLFIRGGNSDSIRDEDLATIETLFPHAQLITIPRVGHWVHAEAPQEFVARVLDFLSRNT